MENLISTSNLAKKLGVKGLEITKIRINRKIDTKKINGCIYFDEVGVQKVKKGLEEKNKSKEIKKSHYSVNDISNILKIKNDSAHRLINKLELETIKLNSKYYILKSDLKKIENLHKKEKLKRNKLKICPYCGCEFNDLGLGEKYCTKCNKYFKRGKEIEYSENGRIIYI